MMSYPLFEHQPYTLALATKMATVAEEENLDLLHVHYAIPHSISAILARESLKPRRRLPVVTTLHGTDITLVGAADQVDGAQRARSFSRSGDDVVPVV